MTVSLQAFNISLAYLYHHAEKIFFNNIFRRRIIYSFPHWVLFQVIPIQYKHAQMSSQENRCKKFKVESHIIRPIRMWLSGNLTVSLNYLFVSRSPWLTKNASDMRLSFSCNTGATGGWFRPAPSAVSLCWGPSRRKVCRTVSNYPRGLPNFHPLPGDIFSWFAPFADGTI